MAFLPGIVLAKGVFLLPFVFKKQMGCYLLLSEMASTINIVVLTKKEKPSLLFFFSLCVEIPVLSINRYKQTKHFLQNMAVSTK